jgi:hypothetical protein
MNPVEKYILNQQGAERAILDYCHHFFTRAGLQPKLSYGLPFYYGVKWVCYCHPLKAGGVELCFTRAAEFTDPTGLLKLQKRKSIAGIIFKRLEDIPEKALLQILEAALAVDTQKAKKNKQN